jgi:putative hydrolase of the HAD superfamily
MVGDSLRHDVEGAIRAGMRGVLLHRGGTADARADTLGVPVIRSLRELPELLIG